MPAGSVRIGTSGYSYAHWRGAFYPPGVPQRRWLEYYAERYDTVEINMTFYRLPRVETFEGWRRRTPEGFRFAVKGSRLITHRKRLADCEEPLTALRDGARRLGEKLGPVLWQLPPSLGRDVERLRAFIALLRRRWPDARHAFEFRNPAWYAEEVFALLRESGMTLCLADMPRARVDDVLTAPLVYVRRHGPGGCYRANYTSGHLREDAARLRAWAASGCEVYVYFNNDIKGHALRNAADLRAMLPGCASRP